MSSPSLNLRLRTDAAYLRHQGRRDTAQLEDEAAAEIERLQEAKREALKVADAARAALRPFADIALTKDEGGADMIDGPDLCITPAQIRAARRVFGIEPPQAFIDAKRERDEGWPELSDHEKSAPKEG